MNSIPKQAQKQEDQKKKEKKRGGITAELILEVNSKKRDEFENLQRRTRDKQDVQIHVIPKYTMVLEGQSESVGLRAASPARLSQGCSITVSLRDR